MRVRIITLMLLFAFAALGPRYESDTVAPEAEPKEVPDLSDIFHDMATGERAEAETILESVSQRLCGNSEPSKNLDVESCTEVEFLSGGNQSSTQLSCSAIDDYRDECTRPPGRNPTTSSCFPCFSHEGEFIVPKSREKDDAIRRLLALLGCPLPERDLTAQPIDRGTSPLCLAAPPDGRCPPEVADPSTNTLQQWGCQPKGLLNQNNDCYEFVIERCQGTPRPEGPSWMQECRYKISKKPACTDPELKMKAQSCGCPEPLGTPVPEPSQPTPSPAAPL